MAAKIESVVQKWLKAKLDGIGTTISSSSGYQNSQILDLHRFKLTIVSPETSNQPGKQEIEKRQDTSVFVPGLILNLRMLGGLLVMNLMGWSVDCLCRSVAEINCSSCSRS